MAKVGLGLIGCGSIGAGMHAPAIANLRDAEFVAVCDGFEGACASRREPVRRGHSLH